LTICGICSSNVRKQTQQRLFRERPSPSGEHGGVLDAVKV
jgi:hypothetical protein